MTIELSNAKVELIDQLTWGQREAINAAMLSNVSVGTKSEGMNISAQALSAAKYKALEVCVVKVTEEGGEEHPYSKEWMDGLTVEDGDKLFDAVNAITNPEKKA